MGKLLKERQFEFQLQNRRAPAGIDGLRHRPRTLPPVGVQSLTRILVPRIETHPQPPHPKNRPPQPPPPPQITMCIISMYRRYFEKHVVNIF